MENTPEQAAPTPQQPLIQPSVPYSTSVLVLGILSIVGCWCWGLPGVVLGIIGLVQAGKGKDAYIQNPNIYSQASLKNLNAGRICAIIGLCLSGIVLLSVLIKVIFFGALLTSFPWQNYMK
jgi:hypothetical protein